MVTKNSLQGFFDINKFPSEEGIIVFPISMSKVSNESQSAKTYWEYIEYFNPNKINKNSAKSKVGAIFVYGDFLYLYSEEKSSVLKKKFMNLVSGHRNAFQRIILGHPHFILDSVSFKVWNQFYVDNDKFIFYLEELKKLYAKDKNFQKYIKEDFDNLKNPERKLDENQINFFLEEHLWCYLVAKGHMQLENKFIDGREKWILIAYPGKPLKGHIYLHQKNFFKLDNPINTYQNSWYDLIEKKLYDFERIDLENF